MPDQLQMMLNGRVIRNLEKNDDQLEIERMVDHWIYFKTIADQEKFSTAVAALGFTVLSKNLKDTTSEFRYELNIGRLDKVDYGSVNNYVLDLWELANQNNGSYDGWGCPAVKKI
jgi:regulator of RNase E activity RraB